MVEVMFLGHIVSTEGVMVEPQKIKVVAEWKPPKNVKEIWRYQGLESTTKGFLEKFSTISQPLTICCTSKKKFVWDQKC